MSIAEQEQPVRMAVQRPLEVAVVAGERSGDALGAGLIEALRHLAPGSTFRGIAGEGMIAAGCQPWYHTEQLSVMGLAEVLRHLPRLLRIRRDLVRRLIANPPDVYVGIDSPDFNLPVAAALKAAGVRTVQYVSPQVWAWRQSRVAGIRAALDLVLCVLPFETDFYAQHGVNSVFVGHPMADAVPFEVDAADARRRLALTATGPIVALLPGSRAGEVARLALPFVQTAAWLAARRQDLDFVVALANQQTAALFARMTVGLSPQPTVIVGRTRDVLAAADVVLTASGTASLEAALMKRPMVVAYRVAWPTYWILRRMGVAKLPHIALPNLLAGRRLVPEFLQGQTRPEALGTAVLRFLEGEEQPADWYDAFTAIHRELRCNANVKAARAVLELLQSQS